MEDSFDAVCDRIDRIADGRNRTLVALAGAPGSGKSTFSARLAERLNVARPARAIVVPMDGFHYDNSVLEARGLLPRKGAPETFDVGGLVATLKRIRTGSEEVAIPIFDRSLELSRAGASLVSPSYEIVLVEGNYLLVPETPWSELAELFDFSIFLSVGMPELERRLIERWLGFGHSKDEARRRAVSNDLPNAEFVNQKSVDADFVVQWSEPADT